MSTTPATSHRWTFFRTGGLDQVSLSSAADLLALEQLDQKLWVALSCPVKGLELDEKTLALIDSDADGRIRAPELLATVKWAAARLKDPADLLRGADALPLAAINDAAPEGKALLASAQQILASLGTPAASAVTVAQTSNTAAIFAGNPINGDGIIPASAATDDDTRALIADIIATLGGATDGTGEAGVTAAKVETFFKDLAAVIDWAEKTSTPDIAILGDATLAAYDALQAVRPKIDDYFARCRLAAFDPRAVAALNRSESEYLALVAKDLKITADEVAGFPLATIAARRPLPLTEGLNPAWAAALAKFHQLVVTPVLGAHKTALDETDWQQLNARFAPCAAWIASKPDTPVASLPLPRAKTLATSKARETLSALLARDQALAPAFNTINDVDRLARCYRDLRTLLHNFVNFADLYSPDRLAIFQAGTLYLDSRSSELCVRVDAASPLAAMSKTYIAYCACTRAGSPPMNIAACFTQGDSDYLFVGRHGVFYDRRGRDWDAVVTSIVDAPISVRQAFFSPYKKFVRMIEEQVAKRAAAAEAASTAKLAAAAEHAAHADKADKAALPAAPKKIDVGTVAALGVAVGAIGGALGAIATGLARLALWQLPLVFIGLILLISLPSMAIAWLKLRQRTLGPLLEANGWAINGRVKINIPFGSALTELAKLPPGAKRSLDDPYEDKAAKRRRRQTLLVVLLLALAASALWIRHDATRHPGADHKPRYFWQDRTPPPAPAPLAPPAAPALPPAEPAPAAK